MSALTYEQEIVSSIPPKRLFKSYILDAVNVLPKAVPGAFKGYDILEGDGGVGTIKQFHFGEGSHFESVKHKIDEIDEENLVFKYTMLDGDPLLEIHDPVSFVVKVEPGPDGGSICKTKASCHPKGVDHHVIEEKIKEGKEKTLAIFKAVEAHLHAHPHEYNY